MNEKMRAEFEAWWREENGNRLYCESAWRGWQASRAALVVDIPKAPSKKLVGGDFLCGWASCVEEISEAIESTGVRVK